MIDFSNVKELSIGGRSVKELWIGGKKAWEKGGTFPALTFTAMQANSTIAMQAVGSAPSVSLEYSTDDGSTWQTFTVGSTTITLANVGDYVLMRAGANGNSAFASNYDVYNKFVMSNSIACSGNINYLLNQNGEEPQGGLAQWTFSYLFNGCTSLTSAPELPARTTNAHSYQFMFAGCTSLTTPPSSLPALNIPEGAYGDMFSGCTSLTSAPTILAGWVQGYACHSMFKGCSSLTIAPSLSSLVYVAEQGLYRMFHSCTALTTPPTTLPATDIRRECYYEMFCDCTSLTTAPALPATTLAQRCYQYMFKGCTLLSEIRLGYTGNFSGADVPYNAFTNWVNGVAASGTFYYNGSDTTKGTSAIPRGWTIQTF